ncbi:MAG: agmatinase [Hyphomicrobiaceae bacterium]
MPNRTLSTFMDVPYVPDLSTIDADIVIQGAPFDLATTGRPGTRFGPNAIRTATAGLRWEPQRWPWAFDVFEQKRIVDRGNLDFAYGDMGGMAVALERETGEIIGKGSRALTLGGDHYITLPLLRAHAGKHGPLAFIQFDAHCDTDVSKQDHHGVMFHKAVEAGLILPDHAVQVGVRTWYDRTTHKLKVIDADEATALGPKSAAAKIRSIVGDRPTYLTFDIDGLDPAFAPGTGTPVAGGLSSNFALQMLRALSGLEIIGADVVEVSPPHDPAGITALAGATVALDLLYVMATSRS